MSTPGETAPTPLPDDHEAEPLLRDPPPPPGYVDPVGTSPVLEDPAVVLRARAPEADAGQRASARATG